MRDSLRQWLIFIGVAVLAYSIDQAVKWRVLHELALGQSWVPIEAIGGWFRITRSLNTGAAFGMFKSGSDVFMILALVTVTAFLFTFPTLPADAWLSRLSIGLVAGGALSNATDRLRFDYVVDYVEVQLTSNFSNISNLADHAIFVGVCLLLLDQWRIEQREEAARRQTEQLEEWEAIAHALASAAPFDESVEAEEEPEPVELLDEPLDVAVDEALSPE